MRVLVLLRLVHVLFFCIPLVFYVAVFKAMSDVYPVIARVCLEGGWCEEAWVG